jgi:hypothetical protein
MNKGVIGTTECGSAVILVCDPMLIAESPVENADAFGRDPATRRSFSP